MDGGRLRAAWSQLSTGCEGWVAVRWAGAWSIVEDVQGDSVPSLHLLTSLPRKKLCEASKKSSRLQQTALR